MNNKKFNNSNTINSSEISQYKYCYIAWILQRRGYEPNTEKLEIGKKAHIEIGNKIDYTQKNLRRAKLIALIGYIIFLISIFLILKELIL